MDPPHVATQDDDAVPSESNSRRKRASTEATGEWFAYFPAELDIELTFSRASLYIIRGTISQGLHIDSHRWILTRIG